MLSFSADGRFEAVYNTETGEIVTDPANMGTYNYAPGSFNPRQFYLHNKYDMDTYDVWGNVEWYPIEQIKSLESGHEKQDAEDNYKDVQRWIIERRIELYPEEDDIYYK